MGTIRRYIDDLEPEPEPELKSKFHGEASQLADLVLEKNQAYGDSFFKSDEILKILYPNGITNEQMKDALAIVRILDKLFRIANRKDAFGENPWKDIAGYALLCVTRDHEGVKQLRTVDP